MVLNKIPTFDQVKSWVNNNADVPNADYADSADDANTVDGFHADELTGIDYVQDTEPNTTTDGDVWADTSDNPFILKVYNGNTSSWDALTAESDFTAHTGDTTNPHSVTDDQTGAATALSNHAGDNSAHHSRYSDGEAQNASHTLQAEGSFSYAGSGDLMVWTMKPNAGNSEVEYILYDLSTDNEIGTMWTHPAGGSGYGYPFAHVNVTTDINDNPEFKVITDET
jgi:hypothetical protein